MRLIKFRAWHKSSNKMVYFNNSKLCTDEIERQHLAMLLNGVYGDVLMQYTGLKDKNDKDIFEGDIVVNGLDKKKYRIEFMNGCFLARRKDKSTDQLETSGFSLDNEVNVVGNVHENKELLDQLC